MKAETLAGRRSYENLLILGGCPRSGTTLAQLLLHATGLVDTANETHILSQIVGPSMRRYRMFKLQKVEGRRDVGPHLVFAEGEFGDFFRTIVDSTIARMRESGRNAPLICEKTPENILFWPELTELLPGARFVEIVRDPRSVYASTKAAAEKWAGSWANTTAGQFARRWVGFIRMGSALEESSVASTRVRYERLVAKGSGYVQSVLAELGIPLSSEAVRLARNATRIQTIKQNPSKGAPWALASEPAGFFRKGEVGSWRAELTLGEVAEIEAVAGDEMKKLGYRLFSS